ncbi:MAG: YceI protein [Gammaproteobacteria bacterium]|nr:YceI protein [Gammaproteobacteria bacterium]
MAMIHHYIHNNHILTRMRAYILNPRKFLLLNVSVAALLLALTIIILSSISPAWAQTAAGAAADTAAAAVPAWQIVPDKSRLGFKATYGSVEFDGHFKEFTAKILFDPKNPAAGSFDVAIDTTSVTTFNAERDSVIGDQDWFYFSQFPKSTYVTKSIRAEGDQFVAVGTLDLKGKQKDVELRFSWQEFPNGDIEVKGQARMLAEANINRIDFGIGSGSWEKDSTVGFEVLVKINLLLTGSK